MKPRLSRNGFTLIEVLLALAIFTIIGIATVKQIQQIMDTKTIAFKEIDAFDGMRAAVSMMGSDLSQAFHVLYDDLDPDTKTAILQALPANHTIFDGRKNQIVFTALSHRVYYTNRRECEQTEISYFLQRKEGASLPSLMKRDSGFIDMDLYQGGPVYTLLDNVTQLEFQYWDEKQQKWIDDWNSDGGNTRDRFPYSVKILLSVGGPGNRPISISTEFKVSDPNNTALLVQF